MRTPPPIEPVDFLLTVPITVADALAPTEVIEFCNGADWFQLAFVAGERWPMHRWRVVGFRGNAVGEWKWKRTSAAWLKGWRRLPCQIVPIGEAHTDPVTRWPARHAEEMAQAARDTAARRLGL